MVFIAILSYPPAGAKEMSKRFLALSPLPTYITRKGPYFSSEIGAGSKAIAIYEFDQSKLLEARENILNRLSNFFDVPGFTYSAHEWIEVKEALKVVGLG
jgi:hypothetical protein